MPGPAITSTGRRTCALLLLLCLLPCSSSAKSEDAILPSSGTGTSSSSISASAATSPNAAANQRSVRSTASSSSSLVEALSGRRPGDNVNEVVEEEEEEGDAGWNGKRGCSPDFVEKFFSLLSGPVGKEAEALVAAVLKLLSENDRVHWAGMADERRGLTVEGEEAGDEEEEEEERGEVEAEEGRLIEGGLHLPVNKRRVYRLRTAAARAAAAAAGSSRGGNSQGSNKRRAPSFNPTGWRRKRSADDDSDSFQRLLQAVITRYAATSNANTYANMRGDPSSFFVRGASAAKMAEPERFPGAERGEWRAEKRNTATRRMLLRRRQMKPKRKPLEFNPTGW